jgi:CysZ protein
MFWSDFGRGVTSHGTAIKFVAKHKLWGYFIVPLGLSILLVILGFFSIWSFGTGIREEFMAYVEPYITKDEDAGIILTILAWIIGTVLGFVFKLILSLLVLKILRYAILIIISPVLALVSERVDEIITGNKYPFEFGQFIKDVFRGIAVSLRNMFFEMLIFLGILLISWIPVVNLAGTAFLMLIGWYFLGFNMMDYTHERRRMSISQGKHFTRKYKGLAMGNGMIYTVLLYIPFLGFTIAPVLSCIAATIATLEKLEETKVRIERG